MTRADLLLVNDIRNILANGTKDENPRPKYEDGTPAYTYFVNHVVRTYNLQTEFPICTLRPQAWKTAIREILAIYQNQSNKISEFERLGCGWWKDWELDDGTIGRSYPYNIESHRPNETKKLVKKIEVKKIPENEGDIHCDDIPLFKKEKSSISEDVVLDRYRVLEFDTNKSDKKHKYYKIQFVSNNYISYMRKDIIGVSCGENPYDRTVYNIGYLGEYKNNKNFSKYEIQELKKKWENMFFRCYSERYKKLYHTYDDKFVHHRWHSFSNFLNDVKYIPQFFLAKEDNFKGWDLDKDYYGSNCYSKDTCVFLKHDENTLYAKSNNGCYEITNTLTNEKYYEINISDFAKKINSPQQSLQKALSKKKFKNFLFTFIPNTDKYVYRYELSRNQVNELISGIKSNPYGRRHIISFWNWANIDKKSLVECAYETIWNVRGEYLDMCLIQRSGDMITASGAGGVNEVQYACLQMMIAKATGYKPGKFTHFVANEQIYDRHIDAANELLNRAKQQKLDLSTSNGHYDYEFESVKMNFNPKSDNFYDFSIEDFSLKNYNPIKPQIKLELGI